MRLQPVDFTTAVSGCVRPCIDNARICMGRVRPCLGSARMCMDSVRPCLGSVRMCMGRVRPCLGSARMCIGSARPCLVSTRPCLGNARSCMVPLFFTNCTTMQNSFIHFIHSFSQLVIVLHLTSIDGPLIRFEIQSKYATWSSCTLLQ